MHRLYEIGMIYLSYIVSHHHFLDHSHFIWILIVHLILKTKTSNHFNMNNKRILEYFTVDMVFGKAPPNFLLHFILTNKQQSNMLCVHLNWFECYILLPNIQFELDQFKWNRCHVVHFEWCFFVFLMWFNVVLYYALMEQVTMVVQLDVKMDATVVQRL